MPKAERLVLVGFALAVAVGCTWGLPGSDAWCADSISPRSCGLFAIAETYLPGHYHVYPPLQMALLSVLSLPWIALAALRVGTNVDALSLELVKPFTMTGVEVGSRLVSLLMGLAVVHNTIGLWSRLAGRRAGVGAGIVVATNAVLVYYAHTGNLEVPYLFWVTWTLRELDRVACGERREVQVLLLTTAAALTKQTAMGALLFPVPLYLILVPWAARRASPVRRELVRGALLAAVFYAVVSGALVNPSGFRRHLAFTFGPGSQTWASYPKGPGALASFARAVVQEAPHFTSWPVVLAAVVGVAIFARGRVGLERARLALPLVAGASFVLLLHLLGRRTEERFLLPASLLLLPYAAVAFDRAWAAASSSQRGRWGRAALALAAVASVAWAVRGVASMDATLLADPRYAAERFLAALPPRTHVEVYGSPMFLPRIPPTVHAVRPGVEPIADRQQIPGVEELVDPALDPRPRAPDVILVADGATPAEIVTMVRPFGQMQYRDPVSLAFFRGLLDGSLGYTRTFRATCSLPWPLECRRIHGSTAGEVWIYERAVPGPLDLAAEPRARRP